MQKMISGVIADDAGRHLRWDLQLFAEGATGGEGTGEGTPASADQGQTGERSLDRLGMTSDEIDSIEDLGIPKERLERYKAVRGRKDPSTALRSAQDDTEDPSTLLRSAQDDTEDPSTALRSAQDDRGGEDPDAKWDGILKDPEYNRRIQDIVQKRVSGMKASLEALAPVLETLGQKYGMDVSDIRKMDLEELPKHVAEEFPPHQSASLTASHGSSVTTQGTTSSVSLSADTFPSRGRLEGQDQGEAVKESGEEQARRRYFDDLVRQGELLKEKIPNFDLQRELEDPRFARMTAPGGGWTVEQAFNAVHHDALVRIAVEQAAREAARALSNSVQAGKSMPVENGSVQRSAIGTETKLYSAMSPEERAAYKKQLQSGRIRFSNK